MAHHAYYVTGETEEGIQNASVFLESEFNLSAHANPDVMTLRHGLLSVDDARRLRALAELAPTKGEQKALIISTSRLFHEAQNALLKLFEEPPAGTVLILVIPAEGMLLPTLRSRLLPLPGNADTQTIQNIIANEFLSATPVEREKMIAKLIDRTKSDKDEEKQAARLAAIQITEGLITASHDAWLQEKTAEKREDLRAFLDDLDTFLPIMHERSAPLKLIFEHVSMVMPARFGK